MSSRLRPWVCKKCIRQLSKTLSTSAAAARPYSSRASQPLPTHSTSQPSSPDPDYKDIHPSSLSYHWDTLPPSKAQLKHASKYFQRNRPEFLWSAPKFHSMDFSSGPEVAFLGRSNVGKSSILNALVGTNLAHTSSKRGRTRAMNAFSIGADDSTGEDGKRVVVLDMPGYGKGGQADWGKQIMKYLEQRKKLKRAFVLIDSEHGLKPTDIALLSTFREKEIPHQIVLSKVDKILMTGSKLPNEHTLKVRLQGLEEKMLNLHKILRPNDEDEGGALGEIIACSAEKGIDGNKLGIDALRFAVLRAVGMEWIEPVVKKEVQGEIVPYDELVWKD